MSVSTVITGGFGSFGSSSSVITDGYSLGAAIVSTTVLVLPMGILAKKITDTVYMKI